MLISRGTFAKNEASGLKKFENGAFQNVIKHWMKKLGILKPFWRHFWHQIYYFFKDLFCKNLDLAWDIPQKLDFLDFCCFLSVALKKHEI